MRILLRSLLLIALVTTGGFAQQIDELVQPEPLVWGLISDYPPYSYINESGEQDGFVYHVISRILDELDIDYVTKVDTWDTMYGEIMHAREVHVYAPFVNIPERSSTVHWPEYSLITSYTTIATLQQSQFSTIEDLADRTFIITENDNPSKRAFESFMQSMRIPYTIYLSPGTPEAIAALKNGLADGYVIDTLFARTHPEVFPGTLALNPRVSYWTCSESTDQWIKDIVDRVATRLGELQNDSTSYYYDVMDEHFPVVNPTEPGFPTWGLLLIVTLFAAVIIALGIVRMLTGQLRNHATELKTAVDEKTVELTSVYEQLVQSEKMTTLGEAVAGMAHEVSTPLGVSYTAATLLNSSLTSSEEFYSVGQDAMPVIVENLRRTGELMHTFKQITIDQTSGALREIVLPDYIDQVWHGLSQKYPIYKNITFLASVVNEDGEEIRLQLLTYPGALSRIFIHLFDNAVEHGFMPEPRKIFSKITCTVRIKYTGDLLTLDITVEDNGVGYPVENQSKLMEPFYTTRTADVNHSGLGLSSVYRTLGKIWVLQSWRIENREGGGVRVQFSIQPRGPREHLIKLLEK